MTVKVTVTYEKRFSFINIKPIGIATTLNRAVRNAIEINANINADVNTVFTLVNHLILTKRSTPNTAVVQLEIFVENVGTVLVAESI